MNKYLIFLILGMIFLSGCKYPVDLDSLSNVELTTYSSNWCSKMGGNFSVTINNATMLFITCINKNGYVTEINKNNIEDYIERHLYNQSHDTLFVRQ